MAEMFQGPGGLVGQLGHATGEQTPDFPQQNAKDFQGVGYPCLLQPSKNLCTLPELFSQTCHLLETTSMAWHVLHHHVHELKVLDH